MAKILVLGCGAMGGIYAAHLARVAEVIAFDTNTEHVAAINRDGIKLTGQTTVTARFTAYSEVASLPRLAVDAVLVLVKAHFTAAAFDAVKRSITGRPLVITLQGGLGNVDVLALMCDWDIAHGASTEAGRYTGPGAIEHLIHGETSWLGPARGSLERVARIGVLFNDVGLATRVVKNPRNAIWSKFIFNSVMNPIGAILRGENRARYEVPEVAQLIDAMFAECGKVATALGITLETDPMEIVTKVRAGELPLTKHAGSMAADIAAGRETELEVLTGHLMRQAHALGVAVPITETVYRLALGVEYAARLRTREVPLEPFGGSPPQRG